MSLFLEFSAVAILGTANGIAIAHIWQKKIHPILLGLQGRAIAKKDRTTVSESRIELSKLVKRLNEFTANLNTKSVSFISEGTVTYQDAAELEQAIARLVACSDDLVLRFRIAAQQAELPSCLLPSLSVPTDTSPDPDSGGRKKKKN